MISLPIGKPRYEISAVHKEGGGRTVVNVTTRLRFGGKVPIQDRLEKAYVSDANTFFALMESLYG